MPLKEQKGLGRSDVFSLVHLSCPGGAVMPISCLLWGCAPAPAPFWTVPGQHGAALNFPLGLQEAESYPPAAC